MSTRDTKDGWMDPESGVGDPFLMPIAANANGFIFQGPGHYSAVLLIDDEEKSRWSFRVNALTPPQSPGVAPGGSGPSDIPRF